jgi:hypothetical protein
VLDLDSEIVVLDVATGQAFTSPSLADPDRMETHPAWSPDGRFLYFSSAAIPWSDRNRMVPGQYAQVKYDLCRVPVDVSARRIGAAEGVVRAAEVSGSVLLPRISPEGRWLICCVCDYGCFPIYRPSSDLFLVDLRDKSHRRIGEWSSEESESYHSWSGNGRWCAFSSKRGTGVFTRTYLAHFDAQGRGGKPFVLPQEVPRFYDACTRTFSVPELIREPLTVDSQTLGRLARSPGGVVLSLPRTTMGGKPREAVTTESWRSGHR